LKKKMKIKNNSQSVVIAVYTLKVTPQKNNKKNNKIKFHEHL